MLAIAVCDKSEKEVNQMMPRRASNIGRIGSLGRSGNCCSVVQVADADVVAMHTTVQIKKIVVDTNVLDPQPAIQIPTMTS